MYAAGVRAQYTAKYLGKGRLANAALPYKPIILPSSIVRSALRSTALPSKLFDTFRTFIT